MQGKVVAITGVASGIGAETARIFREQGARIIGLDRNEPSFPIDSFHHLDIADPKSINAVVAEIGDGIDVLCNSAGLPPTADKFAVLKVNFFGLKHFVEAMADRLNAHASIISVASLAGAQWRSNAAVLREGLDVGLADADQWISRRATDGAPSYHLSKELLVAWTIASWDRWRARGIRINSVSPGPVDTPILKDFIQTLGKRAEDDLRVNRAGTAVEIASVIAFLVSPASTWINGTDISVDGGAGASTWREVLLQPPHD